jgi:hypothetical protein
VWGISDPPEDWNSVPGPDAGSVSHPGKATTKNKDAWPYNVFSGQGEAHQGRK